MKNIIIIGGGASGLMAAITAKNDYNKVLVLEGNNDIAKKILVTGNGRCNYWHKEIDVKSYHTDDEINLKTILENNEEVYNYLSSLGLVPRIKNGYYYPYSNQASSVRDLFRYQLEKKNIEVKTNFKVLDIKKDNKKFIVKGENKEILCDKVILATGSLAQEKLGASDIGYQILKKFNHNINPVLPSLVPLIVKDSKKYNWAGIRSDVEITLISDFYTIKVERGEIQLTEKGISGICVFNLSGYVARELNNQASVSIMINFLPDICNLDDFFEERYKLLGNVTLDEFLNSLLNYKLSGLLLRLSHIDGSTRYSELSPKQKMGLINNITNFECVIIGTEDYSKSQVCTGGISLSEVNPYTMESKIIPNLYITGELLDVDGICGGYNLAFAFISGYLAGKAINND